MRVEPMKPEGETPPFLTLSGALVLLRDNSRAARGTFVGELHEARRFETELFWQLYCAACVLADAGPNRRDEDVARQAFIVQSYTLKSLIWHFSPHDALAIEGLPEAELQGHVARMEWCLDPVILRQRKQRAFPASDDGLINPHEEALLQVLGLQG